ncbi:MAG: thiamine diphosphokinase [Candidatus Atribacteria bacterium]|nr:thiamine diphosphokinase [Candidatus Atribacteria bacterium]
MNKDEQIKKYNHISIIGNGEDWNPTKIKDYCKNSDFIIAADNGLSILDELNITPDLIIGDLDSVLENVLAKYKNIPLEKYPKEKDLTDSEISLQKAISLKPKKISLLAMTGSYFDHSLANIINLHRNYQPDIETEVITHNAIIFPVTSKREFSGLKGRRFSLFPIGKVSGISITGAKYHLKNPDFEATDYSISNVIEKNHFSIEIQNGFLLFILYDKGYN